ncbi:MAG TPA: FecR domain-containing protein [Chitinophagaceae bacterium]|nr:FecR domain-containing protein [Chitinophagaceae bacterium]
MTDEMHNLLGKYFSGQATAAEEAIVQQWAAASEENRADFGLLEKLWHKSGDHEPIVFDTEKAWQAVNAKIRAGKAPVRSMRQYSKMIAVAASIVLLLGVWWLYNNMYGSQTVAADVAVQEVLLRDGSRVYLRKGAKLEYPRRFNKGRREVSLTGEAFFEVTPDPASPFSINAAGARVEVVGTSFIVNTNGNRVELVVKTGRVNFGNAGNMDGKIQVSAGERALLAGNELTKELNRDENFNAWQTRRLVFNNTPLPQVIAALNDYYNVSIGIKREDAAQLSAAGLTARFNNQPLPAVLDEIELITSYRIQRLSDTQYEISIK